MPQLIATIMLRDSKPPMLFPSFAMSFDGPNRFIYANQSIVYLFESVVDTPRCKPFERITLESKKIDVAGIGYKGEQ